ncbi:MAG: GntR family transcriptional regulator [Acetobacteraceae bacterium]|nr:GntR family transcriptional regulator [Acetobacteraceae bacterium]
MDQLTVAPVARHTLHEDLVGRIRDLIIEGQLAPGTRIHEGQLGEALGVSRTPLREALKFLASEGLIDLVPGRGGVVRQLSAQDVRNMLDVLVALECLAGRLACRTATDEQIKHVRSLHDRMMKLYASRNRLEYYKLNQAIHSAIATLSGNDFLASTHEAIQSRLKRIRFIGNDEPDNWGEAVGEHVEMIEALERRDEEALTEILTRHLQETWKRVRPII